MKLTVKYPRAFLKLSVYLSTVIRVLLNILLVITILALAISVGKAAIDLWHALHQTLEEILQQTLLDIVFIIALVEIANTILGYLRDGQVHVRYIVDTILIIMLNEVVSAWFKHPDIETMSALSIVIGTLALVRITVTRWSPSYDREK